MRRSLALFPAAALLALSLAACSTDTGFYLSGTLAADSWGLVSPLSITVSDGSATYTVTVSVANSGVPGAPQAAAFTIAGVPAGTYSVTVSAANISGNDSTDTGYPARSVNEGSWVEADSWTNPWNVSDYTFEATFDGIMIESDTSVDLDLGSGWVS